jgi:hypothetical protein
MASKKDLPGYPSVPRTAPPAQIQQPQAPKKPTPAPMPTYRHLKDRLGH